MNERQLRELRERWGKAYDMLSRTRSAQMFMAQVEASLDAECERLAEIIAEHDDAQIVITEDDGEAT